MSKRIRRSSKRGISALEKALNHGRREGDPQLTLYKNPDPVPPRRHPVLRVIKGGLGVGALWGLVKARPVVTALTSSAAAVIIAGGVIAGAGWDDTQPIPASGPPVYPAAPAPSRVPPAMSGPGATSNPATRSPASSSTTDAEPGAPRIIVPSPVPATAPSPVAPSPVVTSSPVPAQSSSPAPVVSVGVGATTSPPPVRTLVPSPSETCTIQVLKLACVKLKIKL